ncbi:MAG: hypothetical protein PHR92_16955 [Lachnospiraceae bacterium]|nr:hypothetical protein [Lachnospiraceae bacterium]
MDYRAKAINCVKDTALPVQLQWFQECDCDLEKYCRKYGETEYFFAKSIEQGHIYEMGYPKCVCPEALSGEKEASFCECSRQGMIYVLENMMPGKNIRVEIIETVLSGAQKCRFKVVIE